MASCSNDGIFFSIDLFPVFIADGALWIPFLLCAKVREKVGGWEGVKIHLLAELSTQFSVG
jgi:hypothetical protein